MSEFPERIYLAESLGVGLCAFPERYGQQAYVRADLYEALQSQLATLTPVPIDEVPEEWKDNRWVICWLTDGTWHQSQWNPFGKCWMSPGFKSVRNVTHVSLPQPPEVPKWPT